MKQELFEEAKRLGIAFVLLLVMFKIAFLKEDFMSVLRVVVSLFYLFVLPGYFILRLYGDRLSFIERMVVGSLLSAAIIGMLSYYLGIVGLHIKYHQFILPPLMIGVGLFFSLRKNHETKKEPARKDETAV